MSEDVILLSASEALVCQIELIDWGEGVIVSNTSSSNDI